MKNQSTDDEDNTAELLASAKFAYRTLASVLQTAITRLNEDPGSTEGAKINEAVVRSHSETLTQIIELEADLAKRSKTVVSTRMGQNLDLEAAREEINRRLIKLTEQRGG